MYSLKYGINDKLRGKIWMTISKSLQIAMSHSETVFYKLLSSQDEVAEKRILNDIERTLIYSCELEDNKMKQVDIKSKHDKLFNILKAYAIYDSEVNYCQGTNYIVAVLLTNINSERATFWTFLQIMNDKKWRDIFTEGTPKLLRMLDILKDSINLKIPDLFEFFVEINVNFKNLLKLINNYF
jgi:hypothetical protein